MSVPIPVVGEVVIIALASVVLVFEGWLHFHRRGKKHFWIAAMALQVELLAGLMVVHLSTTRPDAALVLTRLEAVMISAMVHSMLALTQTITGRRLPGPRRWLEASAVFWSALLLSPWVITEVAPQTMALLPQPFLRRVMNAPLLAFHVVGFALIFLSIGWLYHHRRSCPHEARFFLVGIAAWTFLALMSAISMGTEGSPYPGGMFEHGFLAFTGCLFLADATDYLRLLEESETAMRHAESSERATKALHEQVVESVGEGLVLLDEADEVLLYNQAMASLTGTPPDRALGCTLAAGLDIVDIDRARLRSWLATARRDGDAVPHQLTIGRGSGRRRVECIATPFVGEGARAGTMLVVVRDLTELDHAHRRHARTARDFLAVVESAPDPIAICVGDALAHVNHALLEQLGYERVADLEGKSYSAIAADAGQKGSVAEGPRETKWKHADGTLRDVEVVTLAIELDGRDASVLIARDLTAARELTARAMQLDRMVAVGTLAAGVGHEINNPLSYLLLNLQDVTRRLPRGEMTVDESVPLLDEAVQATRRIATIVGSLRALSRHDETRDHVDLAEAVRAAMATTAHQASLVAAVSCRVDAKGHVVANEARLTQVFVNLIMNAVHALPASGGGRIEVRIGEADRGRGDWICAEVVDDGEGMSPETVARAFDPFFTTKPEGVGTGLGLSICRETVEAMGGRLEITSRLGEGTTVRVVLPVASSVPQSRPRLSFAPVASDRALSVLIVDDEPTLRIAYERVLMRHATVAVANTGDQALRLLEGGLRPDVILTDLMMPKMNGIELYAEVERRFDGLADRMLFMSGGAFDLPSRRFCARMGSRVLAKPIPFDALVHHVTTWGRPDERRRISS